MTHKRGNQQSALLLCPLLDRGCPAVTASCHKQRKQAALTDGRSRGHVLRRIQNQQILELYRLFD